MAAVNDIYEIVTYCTCGDQTALNVRHWNCSAVVGTSPSDLQIAQAWNERMRPTYLETLSEEASYWGCHVQKIRPLPIFDRVIAPFISPGTVVGDVLPRQVSGVISIRTGVASPNRRGRSYQPFPGEGHNGANGRPDEEYLGLLEEIAVLFTTSFNVVDGGDSVQFEPVLFSRELNSFFAVTGYQVRSKWGSIHKRGDFGRPNPPPS